jgi:hypothetical protein
MIDVAPFWNDVALYAHDVLQNCEANDEIVLAPTLPFNPQFRVIKARGLAEFSHAYR